MKSKYSFVFFAFITILSTTAFCKNLADEFQDLTPKKLKTNIDEKTFWHNIEFQSKQLKYSQKIILHYYKSERTGNQAIRFLVGDKFIDLIYLEISLYFPKSDPDFEKLRYHHMDYISTKLDPENILSFSYKQAGKDALHEENMDETAIEGTEYRTYFSDFSKSKNYIKELDKKALPELFKQRHALALSLIKALDKLEQEIRETGDVTKTIDDETLSDVKNILVSLDFLKSGIKKSNKK